LDVGTIARGISIYAVPVLMAIILHEVAHGWVAEKFGDSTARRAGRITLNPISHIDLIGTIILPLVLIVSGSKFLFGWAKPVPVNFAALRNPKRDMIWVALSGPGTNFILAFLSALILRLMVTIDPSVWNLANSDVAPEMLRQYGMGASLMVPLVLMLNASIVINCVLMVLNLIPVPPLDGGRVAVGLLPGKLAYSYSRIEPVGILIVLLLIFVLEPTRIIFTKFILGFVTLFYFIALRGVAVI